MEKSRVDLSYLKTFSGGDKVLIAEMMERFIIDAPEQLQNIENSIEQKNWKSTYKNLHNFKSSVNFIAIQDIKNLVLEMEKIAKYEEKVGLLEDKKNYLFSECQLLVDEIKKSLLK